jgi:DNA polymerase V
MAAPYFKVEKILQDHKVKVLSSNYALYGDMSQRVMRILAQYTDSMEIYSIDEAFLEFPEWTSKEHYELGLEIKNRIKLETGIPVSIGFANTKTLAKVANEIAKKDGRKKQGSKFNGVLVLGSDRDIDPFLKTFEIGDVWGVGRRYAKKLISQNLRTAFDLKHANLDLIKKLTSSLGVQMVKELNGIRGFELDNNPKDKKGIVSSRSFGNAVTTYEDMVEAISTHATRIGEKLRRQKSLAANLAVFVMTSRFKKEIYYFNTSNRSIKPTNYTPDLIRAASSILKGIFRPGLKYKKCGVYTFEIISEHNTHPQIDLFTTDRELDLIGKKAQIMQKFDYLNRRYGQYSIKLAALGINHSWEMKSEHISKRYTTNWGELLKAS